MAQNSICFDRFSWVDVGHSVCLAFLGFPVYASEGVLGIVMSFLSTLHSLCDGGDPPGLPQRCFPVWVGQRFLPLMWTLWSNGHGGLRPGVAGQHASWQSWRFRVHLRCWHYVQHRVLFFFSTHTSTYSMTPSCGLWLSTMCTGPTGAERTSKQQPFRI